MDKNAENPAGGGGAYRDISSEVECSEHSHRNGQGQAHNRAGQLTEAAQKYRDNHHWVPLRLEGKSPECMGKGWQKRTLKDTIPRFKGGDNLGILLGEPSGDLVRLDPDFAAIPGVTDILFPELTLIYGRASSPRSGRLIISKVSGKDFNLPAVVKDDPRLPLHDGKPSAKVFQILSTGDQTMVPPSIHPETGEEVVWQNQVDPVEIDAAEVLRRAGIEAFLMVVAHFWPARGTRNEAAWSLARVLLEALADRYPDDEKRIEVVDGLVLEVAMAGGDGEESSDGKERARKTLEKMRAGENTTGLPNLVALLGLPADVIHTFRSWLGIKPTYVDHLNERHAVVRLGAKTVILDEQPGQPPQFLTPEDFHLWYANNQIAVSRNKTVAVSRLWIADPRRRQYTRAVFDPTDHDPNHFNLWRGFAVKPDPNKSCKKFLAHLRDNICSGVEEHYQWTMGLFAHMVQRPQEKPGIALVLRGKEGTGKGFLARWLGQICPQHYVVVSQATHITGRFNAHLQQALLVFVDEAFWAGDKAGEGALKHLVTDKDQLIEPKHVTAYMVQSLMRFIIASNEHWVVPAGLEARRWAVFDVADTHKNDRKYFGDINVEMKNGGLEALMHILTTFDLSKVDVFTAPKTAALLDQKTESLPPHERWWLETLQEGYIKYLEYSQYIGETDEWPEKIEKDKIWSSYRSWVHLHNVRSRLWPDKQLHRWLKDANLLPGSKTYRPRGTDDRKRMLTLPALGDCRKAYEAHIGQSVEWHDEEPPQPPPDEELPF
jgi:hypothetical protein